MNKYLLSLLLLLPIAFVSADEEADNSEEEVQLLSAFINKYQDEADRITEKIS